MQVSNLPRVISRVVPVALPWIVFAGCAGPGSGPPLPEDYVPPPVETGPRPIVEARPPGPITDVPDWAGQPSSTDKIGAIVDWLASDSQRSDPYWVVEGHLQLSEGRLSFARSEPRTAAASIVQARTGFDRVLSDPAATPAQRQRAEVGLAGTSDPFGDIAEAATPAQGILSRATWGARPPLLHRLDPSAERWSWITVHHSAMEGAQALDGSLAESIRAIREIQSAHVNGQGYGDIGYHFLIDPAGRIFQGRELGWQGAHAGGANNIGNVGVCLLGNFEVERPTRAALAALDELVANLHSSLAVPQGGVVGHVHWKNTQCPGRHLVPHLAHLR